MILVLKKKKKRKNADERIRTNGPRKELFWLFPGISSQFDTTTWNAEYSV